jgi:hypothetical protein
MSGSRVTSAIPNRNYRSSSTIPCVFVRPEDKIAILLGSNGLRVQSIWYQCWRARRERYLLVTLASAAHQAQHCHEQVDEVQVERQRAHHGLAAGRNGVIAAIVHPLDPLGIVGREACKDANADS